MSHALPALPYAINALEPHISQETLEYHHGKHHQAYVTKLNELIPGTEYEQMSLEDIIRKARWRPLQPGSTGLEPHVLLALPEPERWWRARWRTRRRHQP